MTQAETNSSPKNHPKVEREARVASALRENLKRRKQQQLARQGKAPKDKET